MCGHTYIGSIQPSQQCFLYLFSKVSACFTVGIMLFRALNAPLAVLGSPARRPCSIQCPYPPIIPHIAEYDDFACLQIILTFTDTGDMLNAQMLMEHTKEIRWRLDPRRISTLPQPRAS